ncbi:MAG: glycosyltransferase [Bacteroidales bacterium]|nr:glycosyltransferase [Bacteroidales bacterium]
MYKTKHLPIISVITVVYNSADFIERTILSIINQSYPNIEYLIIDGGSTDGTLEIIAKYKDFIDFFISKPDRGIYDAMNKGIKAASGDYLWFINSGDEIYDLNVLNTIFRNKNSFADIYYGETEITDNKGNTIGMRRHSAPSKLSWKTFLWGMKVSHQSIIVKKEIVSLYDLHYRFSADFDWVINALKKARSIENTGIILSKFMEGGTTKKNLKAGLKERFQIMKKNYGLIPTVLSHIILAGKLFFYYLINKRY